MSNMEELRGIYYFLKIVFDFSDVRLGSKHTSGAS